MIPEEELERLASKHIKEHGACINVIETSDGKVMANINRAGFELFKAGYRAREKEDNDAWDAIEQSLKVYRQKKGRKQIINDTR